MNKSLRKIANELCISASYLSDILNGKKGCSEALKKCIMLMKKNLEKNIII